jgi:hypothetical protein
MATEFETTSNLPHGLDVVTINSVTYVANNAPDVGAYGYNIIPRVDENGVLADFKLTRGAEPVVFNVELQRASDSTAIPPDFTSFTWDHNRSGTASTWVTTNMGVSRSQDGLDVITGDIVLVSYQS